MLVSAFDHSLNIYSVRTCAGYDELDFTSHYIVEVNTLYVFVSLKAT